MIDTHSHIYLSDFDSDRNNVLEKAFENGIEKILMPNIDSKSITSMLSAESQHPHICKAMMGLHPTSVKDDYINELKIIETELDKRKYIAIGEIGIDLYWDKTFFKEQQDALIQQFMWAKEKSLPVVIHTRNAFPEIFDILYKVYDERLKGVFHSFSGTLEDAQKILELPDFYFGINGTITYKNSKLLEILPVIGYEKLLLETDSPYLSPVPLRGKRNEPSFLVRIAEKVAEVFSVSVDEIDNITTRNAEKLFSFYCSC